VKRQHYIEQRNERLEGAARRRTARSKRSAQQQLQQLDLRLGKGKGAQRERERLNTILSGEKKS